VNMLCGADAELLFVLRGRGVSRHTSRQVS
jgi:hypothetical protein